MSPCITAILGLKAARNWPRGRGFQLIPMHLLQIISFEDRSLRQAPVLQAKTMGDVHIWLSLKIGQNPTDGNF